VTRKSNGRKSKTARRIKARPDAASATKQDALAGLVAAGAQALALPIDPAWQAGVTLNLQLLFMHAALVDEFPLPDETEPAPVFRA
jgi:hypothetical protein